MRIFRIISQFKNRKEKLFIELKKILGFSPSDMSYYREAFTHPSYCKKTEKNISYERLEFLGDSIIGAIIATYLFNNAPDKNEGYLTKMRSKMVQRRFLNQLGKKLQLEKLLLKDDEAVLGEDICGNLFESLVGAIYLDKGYRKATQFIKDVLISSISGMEKLEGKITSYKSVVIEWAQKNRKSAVFKSYQDEEDVSGGRYFKAILLIEGEIFSKGRDTSKKKAEEKSAKIAFYKIKGNNKNKRNKRKIVSKRTKADGSKVRNS